MYSLSFTGFLNNTELKKYLAIKGNPTQDRLLNAQAFCQSVLILYFKKPMKESEYIKLV